MKIKISAPLYFILIQGYNKPAQTPRSLCSFNSLTNQAKRKETGHDDRIYSQSKDCVQIDLWDDWDHRIVPDAADPVPLGRLRLVSAAAAADGDDHRLRATEASYY